MTRDLFDKAFLAAIDRQQEMTPHTPGWKPLIDLVWEELSLRPEGGETVGWLVAVEEDGRMKTYGNVYRYRESAEQDATLPRARGQKAEVWECRKCGPQQE